MSEHFEQAKVHIDRGEMDQAASALITISTAISSTNPR
jgi:hypothetical protein